MAGEGAYFSTPERVQIIETISYYETASYLFHNGLYGALSPEEVTHYTEVGAAALADRLAIAN